MTSVGDVLREMARMRERLTAEEQPDPVGPSTNEVLRQHFPKGTDLSRHTREGLGTAAGLDRRSRRTLGWEAPAERLSEPPAV